MERLDDAETFLCSSLSIVGAEVAIAHATVMVRVHATGNAVRQAHTAVQPVMEKKKETKLVIEEIGAALEMRPQTARDLEILKAI